MLVINKFTNITGAPSCNVNHNFPVPLAGLLFQLLRHLDQRWVRNGFNVVFFVVKPHMGKPWIKSYVYLYIYIHIYIYTYIYIILYTHPRWAQKQSRVMGIDLLNLQIWNWTNGQIWEEYHVPCPIVQGRIVSMFRVYFWYLYQCERHLRMLLKHRNASRLW